MNEFIVWDKKQKKFRCLSCIVYDTTGKYDINKEDISIKLVNCWGSPFADNGNQNPDILVRREPKYFTIHQYIGLKDINNKKIYADSSILEFEFGTISNKKLKGYFKYSNYTLGYHIILVDDDNRERAFKFDAELMYDIKIIDTIQENKLGLIE